MVNAQGIGVNRTEIEGSPRDRVEAQEARVHGFIPFLNILLQCFLFRREKVRIYTLTPQKYLLRVILYCMK